MLLVEEFRDIPGYEGLYQVSNLGNVKSLGNDRTRKEKILKPIETAGYFRVSLSNRERITILLIHRIVAITFIPNPYNKRCVNHIDCDRSNNALSNLEWVTYQENENHKKSLGRQATGQRHGMSKLKDEDVLYIKSNYIRGKNCNLLAEMFGVEKSRITKIASGTNWKHL